MDCIISRRELTGPEYAERFIRELRETDIELKLNTMVLSVSQNRHIIAVNPQEGVLGIDAGAVILAMGCRERPRGSLGIPGTRPAGIFTAGTAQRYVNMEGCMVGKKVVILGSGDIGLIMARRMVLEGAQVMACVELMPYSAGLRRNIVQCLDDFDIPALILPARSRRFGAAAAWKRVISRKVDKERKPCPRARSYPCETVSLSVGRIPETLKLSKNAGIELDMRPRGRCRCKTWNERTGNFRMRQCSAGARSCGFCNDGKHTGRTSGRGIRGTWEEPSPCFELFGSRICTPLPDV